MLEARSIQYMVGGILLALFISFRMTKRLGLFLGVVFGFFVLHAAAFTFLPFMLPPDLPVWLVPAMRQTNAVILFLLVSLPVLALQINKASRWVVLGLLSLALFIDICVCWGGDELFLLTWTTFEASIAVLLIPWLLARNKTVATVIACLFFAYAVKANSITAYLIMGAQFCSYAVIKNKWKWLLPPLALCAAIPWITPHHFQHAIENRVEGWTQYWLVFKKFPVAWRGFGLGSFEHMGAFIEIPGGVRYYLMHNDYFQVLFETGWVGFVLFLSACLYITWKARKKPYLFSSCVGILVCMLTYFPLHFFISQVIVCFLLSEILRGKSHAS